MQNLCASIKYYKKKDYPTVIFDLWINTFDR